MKSIIIRTLLALAILAAVPCFATQPFEMIGRSGTDFLRTCRLKINGISGTISLSEANDSVACVMFTAGVIEGREALGDTLPYDLPGGTSTPIEVILLTSRYLNRRPDLKHYPAAEIIRWALMEAFPPQPARQK